MVGANAEKVVVTGRAKAGTDSATVLVHIPKASADDLKKAIIEFEAAKQTLEFKGVPTTTEGNEARSAMETRRATAEKQSRPNYPRANWHGESLQGRRHGSTGSRHD